MDERSFELNFKAMQPLEHKYLRSGVMEHSEYQDLQSYLIHRREEKSPAKLYIHHCATTTHLFQVCRLAMPSINLLNDRQQSKFVALGSTATMFFLTDMRRGFSGATVRQEKTRQPIIIKIKSTRNPRSYFPSRNLNRLRTQQKNGQISLLYIFFFNLKKIGQLLQAKPSLLLARNQSAQLTRTSEQGMPILTGFRNL